MSSAPDRRGNGRARGAPSKDVFQKRFILAGDERDAADAQRALLRALEEHGFEPASRFAIRLALEEALINAFKHGNRNDPAKRVTLDCRVGREAVVIDISDEGEGFDLDAVPDPTEEENLQIPSGRGIMLMRSFMSEVDFHPPGNRVRMVYRRPGAATG
ncbi:MAG: ATP-binding protein [Planctomycetota bacterium]|nr:ATP-binding protein [Planctomycetota bacterium]